MAMACLGRGRGRVWLQPAHLDRVISCRSLSREQPSAHLCPPLLTSALLCPAHLRRAAKRLQSGGLSMRANLDGLLDAAETLLLDADPEVRQPDPLAAARAGCRQPVP